MVTNTEVDVRERAGSGGGIREKDRLEFSLDRLISIPDEQVNEVRTYDSKLLQVFAASSLIMALAGFSSSSQGSPLAGSLLIGAISAYALLAVAVLFSVPWRAKHRTRNPSDILTADGNQDLKSIESTLRSWTVETSEHNERVITVKSRVLFAVMVLSAIEVVGVAAAAITVHMT